MLFCYFILLGLLSVFGLHRLHILWLYSRYPEIKTANQLSHPPRITVQLPLFNEENVVLRAIDSLASLRWPNDRIQIQILDDSTDRTTSLIKEKVSNLQAIGRDISHHHRESRDGYKAGALQEGLQCASGEFIAIFDADFLPAPNFLIEMVPSFLSDDIGMVQARWTHLNRHQNRLTEAISVMLDGHFVLEHSARYRSNRFFNFNGTAGIWRKSCIDDCSGWSSDSVTEDLDISYRAQMRGWRFIYRQDVTVPAEIPSQMSAFLSQQRRWSQGSMQTAKKILPQLWTAPLPVSIKIESSFHLLAHLAHPLCFLLVLLLPIAALHRQEQSSFFEGSLDLLAFIACTLSIFAFYGKAEQEINQGGKLWRFPLVLALGIGLSINQSRAVFNGLFKNDRHFVRTPKTGDGSGQFYSSSAGGIPELCTALYCLLAFGYLTIEQCYFPLPFLLLFAGGFAMVGFEMLPKAIVPSPVEKKCDQEP